MKEYNLEYTDKCLRDTYVSRQKLVSFKHKDLDLYESSDCFVLPLITSNTEKEFFFGGICEKDGKMFEPSKILPNRLINTYDFDAQDALYDDREVIYAGAFWLHWGHFILEEISRLYYFLNEKNPDMPIIYISNYPLSGNFLEFFKLLGIDTKRLVRIDKLTRFKKVYVPEVSMEAMNYYTKDYKRIFDVIKSNVTLSLPEYEKVFFSTKKFFRSKTKDFGEIDEIENLFSENGYKIVHPEQKTLEEQIAIMQSCKEFAAVSGTLPHNLLFASENVKAIILNKSYIVNYQQFMIDDVVNIAPIYIDVHLSIFPAHIGQGPFFFRVTENLLRYANDNNMKLSCGISPCYFERYIKPLLFLRPSFWKKLTLFTNINIYSAHYLKEIKMNFVLKCYLKVLCIFSDNSFARFSYKLFFTLYILYLHYIIL